MVNILKQAVRSATGWSWHDWLLLAVVTGLGAALRFYKLGVVPPGFQFDEAFNAIDAAQVLHGNFPLFLPANAGREVLYTYFQAAIGAILGVNVFSLRLASALLGIGAVGATYVLLRLLIRRESRMVATFTSLTLAVTLWHIHFSHYGIRVITMPLLLSALFGSYWTGLFGGTRRRRLVAFLLCGLLTGLGVWTNPTGRFVPFVLVPFTLWLLWRHPTGALRHRRWALDGPVGGLVLIGLVAALIFLPLGVEFYRHPEWFAGHASEVSIFADRVSGGQPWRVLLANIGRVLGMFSIAGDEEWTHGPAGRPIFDPFLSIPFTIGIGLWLWRLWRRRPDDPDVDALALLGLWAFVMLTPSVFSEAAPNYSRTLPSLPAIFVAAGLGLTWITNTVATVLPAHRWQERQRVGAGLLVSLTLVGVSGAISFYDYFVRFPRLPEVYFAYEANKLDALERLNQQATSDRVYLQPLWANHPPVRFLRSSQRVKALDTADALVLPPPGQGVIYAYPPEMAREAERVAAFWPGAVVEAPSDPFGGVLYVQVKVAADQLTTWPPGFEPVDPLEARFVDAPTLLGMQPGPRGGELILFWRAEERERVRDLTAFIHLIDADGNRVGQIDKLPGNGSYLTTGWTPGERVIERYTPEIYDPCAGGETVAVQVGWYELAASGERRPRLDAPGDVALAGDLTLLLVSHPADQLAVPNPVDLALGEGLVLAGHEVRSAVFEPDALLVIDLYLRGEEASTETPLSLQLEGGQESIPLWRDLAAPATNWPAGEILCRRVRTSLPTDLVPGEYWLALTRPGATVRVVQIDVGPLSQ
jgi:4-amino-4-deoxy-L-arabinose transferase-like glycosyltransferase